MRDRSAINIELSVATHQLVRGLPLIAGLALVFGVAGWVFGRNLPKFYESSAIVVVSNPDLVFRFDPRIETQVNPPPSEGLTEVALSDEIVADLLGAGLEQGLRSTIRMEDLRRDLRVSARGNTLSLRITCPIAETCTVLANRWADSLVSKLNEIYAGAGRDSDAFRLSAAAALEAWEDAQASLTVFQASNEESVLEKSFQSQAGALEAILEERLRLDGLLTDVRGVRARIESQPEGALATPEDRTLVMLLALRSLTSNAGEASGQPTPRANQVQALASSDFALRVLVEIGPSDIRDAQNMGQYLDQLITTIEARQETLSGTQSEIQVQMLELQAALSQAVQDRSRLEEESQLSRETYRILQRKAVESLLATEEERVAQVAANAIVPDEPAGPQPALFAASGAILGVVFGMVWTTTRSGRAGSEHER